MALRDRLVADRAHDVLACLPGAEPAARECLALVLGHLKADPGYRMGTASVTRPDGVPVTLGKAAPMATLARLVQSDICILHPGEGGHVLTAAALCFPASWTLAEKLGQPMDRIHDPVAAYDTGLARRVQRIFDQLRPGHVIARSNLLLYDDPDLYQPRSETAPRDPVGSEAAGFIRSERQTLRTLPESGAVVFGIHTIVMRRADLPRDDQRAIMEAH